MLTLNQTENSDWYSHLDKKKRKKKQELFSTCLSVEAIFLLNTLCLDGSV